MEKDKIIETLNNMGFVLEQRNDFVYAFKYEGLNILYLYSKDDDEFLNFSLPNILDTEDESTALCQQLSETLNAGLKYIKAFTINGAVSVFYERENFNENEDLEELISRIIRRLQDAYYFGKAKLNEIKTQSYKDDDDDDEDDVEDVEDDSETKQQ